MLSVEKTQKAKLLAAAKNCGEWMLCNQININRFDANRGRGLQMYNQATSQYYLTSGWRTGIMCMAMLTLYRRTSNERYLQGAEAAGHYIMSLQILDSRQKEFFGAFREHTPQSDEFCPRDSTSAAWALIHLYNETQNKKYLDRAELFGQWQLNHGMLNGWPLYIVFTNGVKTILRQGAFQSGTGLFFYDLFMATGNAKYIEYGLRPIAEKYRDKFIQNDGTVIQTIGRFNAKPIIKSKEYGDICEMHVYNDDFGNAMMLVATDLFEDSSFKEAALKNVHHIASLQQPNGEFIDDYPSGIPVSLMYFHDFGILYNDEELLVCRDLALSKLLTMQHKNTKDSKLDGGFQGDSEGFPVGKLNINMRVTAYALMALLKLESDLPDVWLGRNNKVFKDEMPDPIDDVLPW